MQSAHYEQLRAASQLPNFTRLIGTGGWDGTATITGHTLTVTAAGNAELHTGLGQSSTTISDNTCNKTIPAGLTTFERLRAFNSAIQLSLIYGKGTCYIPNAILANAKTIIPWWHDRTTYTQRTYVSSNCADSRDVATKALEFLALHKADSFYFVIYFGAPDCAGHTYGENSTGYDDAFRNVDAALGILLDYLTQNSLSTAIILSADHGWNEGTSDHGTADINTLTIPLVSNKALLVSQIYSQNKRKQCDIAPTILSYFGLTPSQYNDITQFGCGSLAAAPASPTNLHVQ
jgi:hypothetical protein